VREESEQSMMSHIQTPYELGHLLRVLSTVNLHAKYKTLETTCALLSNAGLVDLLFDKETKTFALPPAETIVDRLAEAALFDDARTVAVANELDVDSITVQQAQHTLKQFSLSHFWSIAVERIVSHSISCNVSNSNSLLGNMEENQRAVRAVQDLTTCGRRFLLSIG
jgi:hypothetical protein